MQFGIKDKIHWTDGSSQYWRAIRITSDCSLRIVWQYHIILRAHGTARQWHITVCVRAHQETQFYAKFERTILQSHFIKSKRNTFHIENEPFPSLTHAVLIFDLCFYLSFFLSFRFISLFFFSRLFIYFLWLILSTFIFTEVY